jgi:hypothetical protein
VKALIIALTPLICLISMAVPSYFVPVICILPAYPLMILYLKEKQHLKAILLMLIWAAVLGISMTLIIYLFPNAAKEHILNGENYKNQMLEWVLTGIGKESTPAQFIPYHIFELIIFIILSLCSASLLSIILGAFLMNYMAYYVANLALIGKNNWLLILGWHPWSLLRIISYVILGVVLSEPLLSKITHNKYNYKPVRKYFIIAILFWLSDLILKALLAPYWQKILKTIIEKI